MPMQEIAPGVAWLPLTFVNVYAVGEPGGPWTLVDAGLPSRAAQIREAAEARFGVWARPRAIVLTHGHGDHVGSASDLAGYWGVPIYAHPLELPYVTGKSSYPPPDPTIGGVMGLLSRFIPTKPVDLGGRARELPLDGEVPGMPGWRVVETPGHSPGHVSFFREADRTLLAGDALATVSMESVAGIAGMLTGRQEIARPSPPVNTDWTQVGESIDRLAALRPTVLACGHGAPMAGLGVADELALFARNFAPPPHGRYVAQPARTDRNGIVDLPPPAPDPLPKYAALAGGALAAASVAARLSRRRRQG